MDIKAEEKTPTKPDVERHWLAGGSRRGCGEEDWPVEFLGRVVSIPVPATEGK